MNMNCYFVLNGKICSPLPPRENESGAEDINDIIFLINSVQDSNQDRL